jgi:SH3-like domain-containing protein
MSSRYYFIGGIGVVVLALSGIVSGLGVLTGVENLFKHEETQIAVVKEDEVRIHAGPNKDDQVEALLEEGDRVRVIRKQGAWLKVTSENDDALGWIRGNTVVLSSSSRGQENGAS